ncbi:hypothetical protein FNV43_RR07306 [Rhamnella rubrinervis]|uniref:Thaumatin-like protein n=1 Tax=Rhamnella rubrinervis TaxID=2594499 RepID=A0A8K0HGC6_9ROSA|nr:hypothetical protein FNV43_RR07306 [Rhamnella rubrinervis]
MAFFQNLSIFTLLLLILTIPHAKAATFNVRNNCGFTVWAAAVPGGGRRLNRGQTWSFNVKAGTAGARIWARTGCNAPPMENLPTLAECALNQYNNLDFFDVSLVDGFNVPMEFSPTSQGCTRGIRCTADISGQCPNELKAPGGCNNPCTVYKTDQYCCNSGTCGPQLFEIFQGSLP